MDLKENAIIIFQGDSITDAGRLWKANWAGTSGALGDGYVKILASRFQAVYPQRQLQILNRGVSGNKITDLYDRWTRDTLDLIPDLVSILIGVNDTWHGRVWSGGTSVSGFESVYRALLYDTKTARPNCQLVLCEPFVLVTGVVTEDWLDEILARQEIVRKLAKSFQAVYVPFQTALNEIAKTGPAAHWLEDGVHPTPAGHKILADCWWQHVE